MTIELPDLKMADGDLTLEILTTDGRMVDRTTWQAGKSKAMIQDLDPGHYLIRLVAPTGSVFQKPLIQTNG